MGQIIYRRVRLGSIVWILVGTAILSSLQSLALPPATTIGHPVVPGVPEWVYSHRVSPDLRSLFILQYGLAYQAEQYQQDIYPKTALENFKLLNEELGAVIAALASAYQPPDPRTDDTSESLLEFNVPTVIQSLHDRIREEVFKNNLQDIANSPDLVPSIVPARPTTIGPRPVKRPKLLTHEEVIKLLQNPVGGSAVVAPPHDDCDYDAINAERERLEKEPPGLRDAVLSCLQREGASQLACSGSCDNLNTGLDTILACQAKCPDPSKVCSPAEQALSNEEASRSRALQANEKRSTECVERRMQNK